MTHRARAEGRERALSVVHESLPTLGVGWEEPAPGRFVVTLPGERKLSTTCAITVAEHGVTVRAFVIRHPDENIAEVHRWLLEQNLRAHVVAFAVDSLGDVYLVGRLPHAAFTPDELDRLLGSVLEQSDGAFNTLLELGFASAIRKEWQWRTSRGEPTRNLDAFRHLMNPVADPPAPSPAPADPA